MVVGHAAMPDTAPRASYRLRDIMPSTSARTHCVATGASSASSGNPMELLILLVERQGQLVTRAEIVDVLWGQDVFVDVETGVHTAIRKIRQALRDAPEAPTFIETVPGKGYRFVAPVETMVPAPSPDVAPPVSASPQAAQELPPAGNDMGAGGSRRERVRSLAAVAGLLVALAVLASFAGWPVARRVGVTEPDEPLTIAVLPFELLGGDPANAYIADGLMEDTIASLGRIDPGRITVIGRTSMQAYRGTSKSIAEIGRELDADYLVEGSLRAEGERLQITSRLVRPADQVQVWSQTFDRVVGRTFGIRAGVEPLSIADHVHIRLSPAASQVLDRRHSRNEEAFDHFLRGRSAFHLKTPAAMRDAVAAFQRATELDPEYALAWATSRMSHAMRAINADADPRVALRLSRQAAQLASTSIPSWPKPSIRWATSAGCSSGIGLVPRRHSVAPLRSIQASGSPTSRWDVCCRNRADMPRRKRNCGAHENSIPSIRVRRRWRHRRRSRRGIFVLRSISPIGQSRSILASGTAIRCSPGRGTALGD